MESLLTNLASKKLSTYAAITLMFTYTILLNRDFACTCKSQLFHCYMYLILPFFIILFLILWTDRSFQRVCRYVCSCSGCCRETGGCSETKCNFKCSVFLHILKAALVSLLWVAFVLLDGDWYLCCAYHPSEHAPLACKAVGNITEKEQVIINDLKNESRVIGGSILCVIVVVASLILPSSRCCKGSCCTPRFLYDKLILEEEDIVRKEFLREFAKDQLTKKVKNIIKNGWEDCSEIAVNLLKPPPEEPTPEDKGKQPAVEGKPPPEEPTTEDKGKQPAVEGKPPPEEPTTEDKGKQPAVDGKPPPEEPTAEDKGKQPAVDGKPPPEEPTAEDKGKQPAVDGKPPSEEPTAEDKGKQPAVEGKPPPEEPTPEDKGKQPAVDGKPPPEEPTAEDKGKQPAVEGKPPPEEPTPEDKGKQPAVEGKQRPKTRPKTPPKTWLTLPNPEGEGKKTAVEGKQPAVEEKEPAGKGKQPAEKGNEQEMEPLVEAEHPSRSKSSLIVYQSTVNKRITSFNL